MLDGTVRTAGTIFLNDTPLSHGHSKAFARQVAYLPQQLPAAEGMTVPELVAIGRYPWHGALGRFKHQDKEKVEEAITLVGLKPFAHRLVDSLSGGERQRAWLAMMVAQDSRCLLLDEPTSALDIAHQKDVLALIQRLSREKGLTVIAVLHDLNMAARYCDQLMALRGGEMIAGRTGGDDARRRSRTNVWYSNGHSSASGGRCSGELRILICLIFLLFQGSRVAVCYKRWRYPRCWLPCRHSPDPDRISAVLLPSNGCPPSC